MADIICLTAEKTGLAGYVDLRLFPKPGQLGRAMDGLTPRQQEILGLLAKGFYYKEIAAALGISPSTVRAHLHSVYRKLKVRSRARAVIKFHEHLHRQSS